MYTAPLNETERTTIVDIFNIIQTVRDTGIHLKVDKEQWRIAQGSNRQASGYGPHVVCNVRATTPRYSSCTVKNKQTKHTVLAFRLENQKRRFIEIFGDQQMTSICCTSNSKVAILHPSCTFNVRTAVVNYVKGIGHIDTLLRTCAAKGCGVIGLLETIKAGTSEISVFGYRVFLVVIAAW